MSDFSATDVANIVTFVAPGVAASRAYQIVYPQPEAGELRTTVTAVALSLPIVAVVQRGIDALGFAAPRPLQLGYLAALLGAALVAGYVTALVRGTDAISRAVGWLSNPMLGETREALPDPTVIGLVLGRLESDAWVTVTLTNGRLIAGNARLWSQPLDVRQQLYLNEHQWWKADLGKWGDKHEEGGVVVDLEQVVSIEVSKGPKGV